MVLIFAIVKVAHKSDEIITRIGLMGAVPGPAVPPIATKGASAAKGTAGLPAGLRPARGCLAASSAPCAC